MEHFFVNLDSPTVMKVDSIDLVVYGVDIKFVPAAPVSMDIT